MTKYNLSLSVNNLIVTTDSKRNQVPILKGLNLLVNEGEVNIVMGPNGSGKSTLSKVLAGHPSYKIKNGSLWFLETRLIDLAPEMRAKLGLFLGFQYPVEISGVSNQDFLRLSYEISRKKGSKIDSNSSSANFESERLLKLIMHFLKMLHIPKTFLGRSLNHGFSGGEKKKNEVLQMAMLNSKCVIMDELDSGLDIDALRILAKAILIYQINGCFEENYFLNQRTFLLITHYKRLLKYIEPHIIHILEAGNVVCRGNLSISSILEKKGYNWMQTKILPARINYLSTKSIRL